MDLLVRRFSDFSLWQVKQKNLFDFSSFVVKVNYECYKYTAKTGEEISDIEEIFKYDCAHFDHAFFYALKSSKGQLIATIKVTRWNESIVFPLVSNFGIDIPKFLSGLTFKPKEIWHLGRLAIDHQKISCDPVLSKYRTSILKIMLIAAFNHICTDNDNIMLAECDNRLNEKIKLMGIHSIPIGESIQYLGSETTPIYNTGNGLSHFLKSYGYVWNFMTVTGYIYPPVTRRK
ncbi:MAG: hypothetical protein HC905_01605 [Bacteroidales bacterium]|nr:hypothetical protein [Bacteroidales bacterium]